MASKLIGVELGSDTLKLAEVRGGTVTKLAVKKLPNNVVREGRIAIEPLFASFVKSLMKEKKFSSGDCALALPPQVVISQRISLPVMTEYELRLNLPYEFREYVGNQHEDYSYDYIVLSMDNEMMELYVSAIHNSILETYFNVLKKAGLTMKMAMPTEMAWLNLINHCKTAPEKLCIVDLGQSSTRVNIYANGNFVMGKNFDFAGQLLDETIATNLQIDPAMARNHKESNTSDLLSSEFLHEPFGAIAVEVMKIVNFYNSSRNREETPLEDLYYAGGTAQIQPLLDVIERATNLRMHHIGELISPEAAVSAIALRSCAAAGATMQKP